MKKIEPIIALRDGMENHNFKKNHINLEKSKFGLNISFSLKTMFNNIKQNIITFFVTGLICFICTLGILMLYNFGVKPNLNVLTFETCNCVVGVENSKKDEVLTYLKNDSKVSNIRTIINITLEDNDNEALQAYIVDDASKLRNQEAVYKGRMPKYDNEIVVSGAYAKSEGYSIGDEIDLTYGTESYKYLITGLMQTCNNNGREAIVNNDGAKHIMDIDSAPMYYWFDIEDGNIENDKACLDEIKNKFGESIISTMNFDDVVLGGLQSFKAISTIILISVSVISVIIIILVLYLLIKTLVFSKRNEYGILKAIGYKSKDLIIQTSISFMPSIIISVVVFSIISYLTANFYMDLIMRLFGLMKCNFAIPVSWMFIMGVAIIIISLVMSILMSKRIKKIEPYNLLIAE